MEYLIKYNQLIIRIAVISVLVGVLFILTSCVDNVDNKVYIAGESKVVFEVENFHPENSKQLWKSFKESANAFDQLIKNKTSCKPFVSMDWESADHYLVQYLSTCEDRFIYPKPGIIINEKRFVKTIIYSNLGNSHKPVFFPRWETLSQTEIEQKLCDKDSTYQIVFSVPTSKPASRYFSEVSGSIINYINKYRVPAIPAEILGFRIDFEKMKQSRKAEMRLDFWDGCTIKEYIMTDLLETIQKQFPESDFHLATI